MDYEAQGTGARVREWQYLTGADFAAMDRARTVVTVSCSPLEVHGPHLPVIADNHEAEGITLRALELLSERDPDIEFLHLPPIYVATDVVPQPGSLAFRGSTIRAVLEDLGRSLAKQGFRHVWVGSFHGGPRHFVNIEQACANVNRDHGIRMVSVFSLLIAKLTDGSTSLESVLGELEGTSTDKLRGDTHGGAVETSLLLHLLGDRVRDHRALPQRTVDKDLEARNAPPLNDESLLGIVRGFREKLRYFTRESYAGDPAHATPELGAKMLEVLAGHAADALHSLWEERLDPADCHSPLWKLRWVFTVPAIGAAFERAIGYRSQVF